MTIQAHCQSATHRGDPITTTIPSTFGDGSSIRITKNAAHAVLSLKDGPTTPAATMPMTPAEMRALAGRLMDIADELDPPAVAAPDHRPPMVGLQPIATAPRTGTRLTLAALNEAGDVEVWCAGMTWNAFRRQWVVTDDEGVVLFVWSSDPEEGPTHWKPYEASDHQHEIAL